jgi:sugar lactone lactonase YvrE
VAARLARQAILDRTGAPQLWRILDEGFLHRAIGGSKVMRSQLYRLAEVAEYPKTTIQFPNGMVITPDGRTLIISESFAGQLTAFGIDADGGLSGRRVFAGGLGPDGITMDAEGAVWVSAGGFSVVRVAERGRILQRVGLAENRRRSR